NFGSWSRTTPSPSFARVAACSRSSWPRPTRASFPGRAPSWSTEATSSWPQGVFCSRRTRWVVLRAAWRFTSRPTARCPNRRRRTRPSETRSPLRGTNRTDEALPPPPLSPVFKGGRADARVGAPRRRSTMTETFLLLQLDSEGSVYSKVAEILENLGFRPETEGYDFVYDWGRSATVRETLELADRIQEALRGSRVSFRIESTED